MNLYVEARKVRKGDKLHLSVGWRTVRKIRFYVTEDRYEFDVGGGWRLPYAGDAVVRVQREESHVGV